MSGALTGRVPPADAGADAPAGAGARWLGPVGLAVATALSFVSAVWEAFLTPLMWQWTSGGHAHYVRLPVALLAAILGNAALVWFTSAVTGRLLAVMLPFVTWIATMLVASMQTREHDLVLAANNWVAIVTMLAGAVAFAAAAFALAMRDLARPGAGAVIPSKL